MATCLPQALPVVPSDVILLVPMQNILAHSRSVFLPRSSPPFTLKCRSPRTLVRKFLVAPSKQRVAWGYPASVVITVGVLVIEISVLSSSWMDPPAARLPTSMPVTWNPCPIVGGTVRCQKPASSAATIRLLPAAITVPATPMHQLTMQDQHPDAARQDLASCGELQHSVMMVASSASAGDLLML